MGKTFTAISAAVLLVSCSTLPVPEASMSASASREAVAVLRDSARRTGDGWKKYRKVEVAYSGEWSGIATRLQPVLTDSGYRKTSEEEYLPRLARVRQVHRGPFGSKEVICEGRSVEVTYDGVRSGDEEVLAAAALVADAYRAFLFGSSWLAESGQNLHLLEDREFDGESCRLVAGRLEPGFGPAGEDHFIAWIGVESGLLKRLQFTLNGLESTRGADVDVVFAQHWKARDGSVWPGHFIEYIQRPLLAKAHEWRTTALKIDGQTVKVPAGLGAP